MNAMFHLLKKLKPSKTFSMCLINYFNSLFSIFIELMFWEKIKENFNSISKIRRIACQITLTEGFICLCLQTIIKNNKEWLLMSLTTFTAIGTRHAFKEIKQLKCPDLPCSTVAKLKSSLGKQMWCTLMVVNALTVS